MLSIHRRGGQGIVSGHQKEFNNSDELWHYLFPDIDISSPNGLKELSVPDEVTKAWRITSVQPNNQPVTIRQKTLKEHWDMWISDWSPRPEGIKKVVYTDKVEPDLKQSFPKIDKLYKCHKGTTWYTLHFGALSSESETIKS